MIPKSKKNEIIKELEENIKKAKAIYFTKINGLKTPDLNKLREEIKKINGRAKVIKKTLLELVLNRFGLKENWREKLEGSVLVNFAFDDPVAPAKVLKDFSKQNENFKILGGLLEKEFLGKEKVEQLASIPPKNVLYGRLAGSLISPIQRFNYALKNNLFKLTVVLNGIASKKQA